MLRREFLKGSTAASLSAVSGLSCAGSDAIPVAGDLRGRINHSVCKWCYPGLTVEELATASKRIGVRSVELLDPEDWPVLARLDMTCAMANGPQGIEEGWNDITNHDWLVSGYQERIPAVANAGYPNVICFSGNRNGIDDDEGLDNCVRGLQQIMPTAERTGVTVCMELLNSKVDHIDYQCDHTTWGVELVNRVGSERFKLLYDIYHMQIMEGDVIRTIRENADHIAHYHTGGNPGRHEIDDTQELNYKAIMKAIVETGFAGYVAQEFIPTRDPLTSLQQGIRICDV